MEKSRVFAPEDFSVYVSRQHFDLGYLFGIYLSGVFAQDDQVGKKLGFITQEIGREINTLGSKANDSDIQKLVIQMKDELEKIKEQLLNVL